MATEPAIGTRIKRARERMRWSQQQLAAAVHVDRKTIDNWENGRTKPRSSIGALEVVLGVRLDEGPPPEDEMPTPEELERLREHMREVLGENSAAEAALDATLAGEPLTSRRPSAGGGPGRLSGRRTGRAS